MNKPKKSVAQKLFIYSIICNIAVTAVFLLLAGYFINGLVIGTIFAPDKVSGTSLGIAYILLYPLGAVVIVNIVIFIVSGIILLKRRFSKK
jgi:hypothetical protein